MKCQILFSKKNKNISECSLLNFLPSMQSDKGNQDTFKERT